MVMHARKLPKLSDGYYSRHEARPYENMDKYPSSKAGRSRSSDRDRYHSNRYYEDSPSPPSFHDDDSDRERPSPRFTNKSSYTEKTRSRVHDRGTSRSPGEKRANNHTYRNGPMRHSSRESYSRDSYRNSRERDSREREYSRERDLYRNSRENHRETRDSRLASSRDTSHRNGPIRERERDHVAKDGPIKAKERDNHVKEIHQKKDVRAEVQKTASRVCGDWSEHTSSSGKTFYYNCKQNVSKWEKPKEWNDAECTIPDHIKKQNAAKVNEDRRQSSSSTPSQQALSRSSRTSSSSQHVASEHKRPCPDQSLRNSGATSAASASSSGRAGIHKGGAHHSNALTRGGDRTPSETISRSSNSESRTKRNVLMNSYTQNGRDVGNASRHTETRDCRQEEDMDESPIEGASYRAQSSGTPSTPSSSVPLRQHSQNHAAVQAVAQSPGNGGEAGRSGDAGPRTLDSHEANQQAAQSLQKSHHALSRQSSQNKLQHVNSHSPGEQSVDTLSSHQSPNQRQRLDSSTNERRRTVSEATNQDQEDMVCDDESPKSDASFRSSRCSSPAGSRSSSPNGRHNTSGAAIDLTTVNQQPPVATITPSLANFYDERLIGHVKGWSAEHFARQADHFMYEAHTVGSLHCTQVSADLKKARSLVRIAEIQSTLQEQRILFLIQQVKGLENTKSNQASYLPT